MILVRLVCERILQAGEAKRSSLPFYFFLSGLQSRLSCAFAIAQHEEHDTLLSGIAYGAVVPLQISTFLAIDVHNYLDIV